MNSVCNHLQFENTIDISFFAGKMSQRQPIGGPPSDTWPYVCGNNIVLCLCSITMIFKFCRTSNNRIEKDT